jgi:hypothetical protein
MSKTFLLHIPDSEHQALKIAAVQSGTSMNQFIRDAIAEKIARQNTVEPAPTSDTLNAKNASHSASDVPQ